VKVQETVSDEAPGDQWGVHSIDMGVSRGGQVPPEFGAGDANANCPSPQILSYRYKNERCGLQNTPKSVFGRGFAPDPAGGAHDAPPDLLVGWRGDTPPHILPHSARTYLRRSPCVPAEVQPDLRLCP